VLIPLFRLQEPVVHRQVNIHNHYIGHRRRASAQTQRLRHRLAIGRAPGVEQQPQGFVHSDLTVTRGEEEDCQIFLDRAAGPPVLQHVVGHPESAGRKHCVAVAVLLERSRLAYQPVDDVAVLDAMFLAAPESRQGVDLAGAVPDLQCFGHDVNIHQLADQTAGQRVDIAADVDRAPRIDACLDPSGHLQPARRQRRQHGRFLKKTLLSLGISLSHELAKKRLIIAPTGEIAASPQHQGLVDGQFEPVMTLLDVAVLVGFARLDRLGFEAVMRQERLISSREQFRIRIGVHGGAHAIGAMPPGNSSQFPQGVLQPFTEALEAFGEADRGGLPVGIREHEVIHQMIERLTGDRDAEFGHVSEITLGEPARLVGLREEHLLGRPFQGAPLFDPALQATELDVGEPPREAALQVVEERLGLEPGVEPELRDEFGPDVLERILPGPPGARDAPLTGQGVRVAVLACRFLVDAGLVGGLSQCVFGLDQLPQPPEQAIGNHPSAPA